MFGDRLPLLERYAGWLAGAGIERGLLGPREAERLWPRHLLNCAGLADLVVTGASVCDVGSGAGLPGVVLAAQREDCFVVLLEPLLRRATFLEEVVADLGLRNARVVRGRAEQHTARYDVVTSRAVAPLDRLAAWSLPLVGEEGVVLALKGARARQEVEEHAAALAALGVQEVEVVDAPSPEPEASTEVVRLVPGPPPRRGPGRPGARGPRVGRSPGSRPRRPPRAR
nr:16S rRNA (guanine(527)-N(7))-methyltransferase RsmG [Vallicoccus soli]